MGVAVAVAAGGVFVPAAGITVAAGAAAGDSLATVASVTTGVNVGGNGSPASTNAVKVPVAVTTVSGPTVGPAGVGAST